MVQKKILVWDFDHTLAYRKGMWGQTAIDLLHKRHLTQFSPNDLSPYLQTGFPWHEYQQSHYQLMGQLAWWEYIRLLIGQALRHLSIPEHIIISVLSEYRGAYLDLSQWALFDDTLSTLRDLEEHGYEHVILSNHVPELHELVTGLHLAPLIAKTFSSATIGYEKPHPQIFTHLLDTLGKQHTVVMIGDSYQADILGATTANIPAILVRKHNVHHYPFYAQNLSDIDTILDELMSLKIQHGRLH